MTKPFQIYKCNACGNIVEVIHGGLPAVVCCKLDMVHLEENTVDASKEKHVPVMEQTSEGLLVRVGSVAHPMEDKHFIEFIEVISEDGKSYKQFLKPGGKPEAFFPIKGEKLTVREYCNLHGLWKA